MTIGKEKLIENFWKRIQKKDQNSCWLWTGSQDGKGYGQIKWNGKRTGAHRMAYALSGNDLSPDLVVAHKCDTPLCCNPNHLFAGTQADNLSDMREKNRGYNFPNLKGELHGRCIVSDAQCEEIKKLYSEGGISQQKLASKYGIGQTQISRIIRGESR